MVQEVASLKLVRDRVVFVACVALLTSGGMFAGCGGSDGKKDGDDGGIVIPDAAVADGAAMPDAPVNHDGTLLGPADTAESAPDGGGGTGGTDAPVVACTPAGATCFGVGASVAPALIWDGTNYGVLWGDKRGDAPGIYLARTNAARVVQGAPVLVGAGTAFSKNAEIAKLPAGGFLVVWEECGQVNGADCEAWEVRTRTLDAALTPTGAVKTMSEKRAIERRPYVLSALGKTFVTFRDSTPAEVPKREWIAVVAVDAAGDALATPAPYKVDVAGKDARFPYLAASDTSLALVYTLGENQSEVHLTLLTADLALVKDLSIRQGAMGKAENVQAGWIGNQWLVAWEDGRSDVAVAWVATVDATATTAGAAFALSTGNTNWPVIAYNGTNALVAFYGFPDGGQVVGQQLSGAGALVGAPFGISPLKVHDGRFPFLFYNPTSLHYVVVYVDRKTDKIVFMQVALPA